MNVDTVRAWLMMAPKPKSVRVSKEDSNPQTIEVTEGVSWVRMAETINALQADLVEALDAEGKMIRAIRPSEVDAEKEDEEEDADFVVQDPESARLIIFAKLISRAYEHSTNVAFDKMISLFEASTRRTESLEHALEITNKILTKAASDQLAVQVEQAAGGSGQGSLFEQIVAAFLQGQAAKQATAEAAHVANGVAKKEDPS